MRHIDCPKCGKPLKVPASDSTLHGKCFSCGHKITVEPRQPDHPKAPEKPQLPESRKRWPLLLGAGVACAVLLVTCVLAYQFWPGDGGDAGTSNIVEAGHQDPRQEHSGRETTPSQVVSTEPEGFEDRTAETKKPDIGPYSQFRDVVLGTAIADYPGMEVDDRIPPECVGDQAYKRPEDTPEVDGVWVQSIRYYALDGDVYEITAKMRNETIKTMIDVLTDKFGKPTAEVFSDPSGLDLSGEKYWMRADKKYAWKVQWITDTGGGYSFEQEGLLVASDLDMTVEKSKRIRAR